jgi:nucleotide-binding universal stress UspA family protein
MQGSESSNRLLIATDGSPGSLAAAEEGVRLAKLLGAGVTFVGVAHAPLRVLGQPYYQRALNKSLGARRAALAKSTPFAVERLVEYETELLEGSPAEVILDLARSRDVDLIVVGSRGLGPAKGSLLGSVSSEIVQKADRPVLVARPIDHQRSGRLTRIAV